MRFQACITDGESQIWHLSRSNQTEPKMRFQARITDGESQILHISRSNQTEPKMRLYYGYIMGTLWAHSSKQGSWKGSSGEVRLALRITDSGECWLLLTREEWNSVNCWESLTRKEGGSEYLNTVCSLLKHHGATSIFDVLYCQSSQCNVWQIENYRHEKYIWHLEEILMPSNSQCINWISTNWSWAAERSIHWKDGSSDVRRRKLLRVRRRVL